MGVLIASGHSQSALLREFYITDKSLRNVATSLSTGRGD